MSLEKRIAEALTATEDYQPSADLFERIHRSIEEDRAHRRRLLRIVASTALGLTLLGLFITATSRTIEGALTIPKWSLEVVITAVLVTILVTLGPALRRLGGPLLDEVFHLSRPTGIQFSRLLDMAYYLFFGGVIVINLDTTDLQMAIAVPSEELWVGVSHIAELLLWLGVAHVLNLIALPLLGLLFTSLMRRTARRAAGEAAPPESPQAHKVDRLTSAIVLTATLLGIAGAVALIGAVLVGVAIGI